MLLPALRTGFCSPAPFAPEPVPELIEFVSASASIPAETHELKCSVAGGCWVVGTTLSSRDGSGRGARDMVVQCRAYSAMRGGDEIGGVRTLQDRSDSLEAAVRIN